MEFALAANDAMGNVVAIAEDDCHPGFHCELLWREGEIIDVHLHVRRANGHCRNGGESGGDKKCAGAAPGAKSQHAGSFLSTVSTAGQRRIGDREGSFAAPDFDARYAQQTTQLFGWHEHRSWRGRGSRRGLREGRRHGGMEGDMAFDLLHQLMDMAIEHGDQRWCMNRMKALFFPDVLVLFDPDGDRHAEAGHAVEDIASDLRLGLLIWQCPGVKASADDGFVSVYCRFDSAPPGISRTPLPANAAMPCNRLEMHVALRRRSLARNGRRSRRE
jgi:hypothetical protein